MVDYFYWYILNLISHTWDFSLSMADIYRAVSRVVSGPRPKSTTMSSDNPIHHVRHLSGHVQSTLRTTSDVNNHEIRQPHLSWETSFGPCQEYSSVHVQREQSWVQATPSIMIDIYRAVSPVVSGPRLTWTTMSSGSPIHHERHLSGRVKSSLRATSNVNNHEFRQPHLSWETSIGPCQE